MLEPADKIKFLPDAHTDFTVKVTVESWWPWVIGAVLAAVICGWFLRRRIKR